MLKRERASQALPNEIINLVGPDALTGSGIAKIWAAVLNKQVNYTGSDTAPFEARLGRRPRSYADFAAETRAQWEA
ncbi:MAG: hypothetical protein RLZZ481_1925 [Pseudomonadota bacterium]